MKRVKKFPGKMLALVGAMGLSAAFAAPAAPVAPASTAVYQRPSNSESIELSNIPDEGAVQLPITLDPATSVGSYAPDLKSAGTAAAKPAPLKVKKKVLKKVLKADGTEEELWVDSEEDVDSADPSDSAVADSAPKKGERTATSASGGEGASGQGSSSLLSSGGSLSSGGFSGGSYSGGSNGEANNGAGTPTASNGGSTGTGNSGATGSGTSTASNGGSTGSGSTGATGSGTSTASNGGSTGSGTAGSGSGTTSTATSALETKLETYRNLMLNEVANAQVANPAITRRYQMMNRSAYQRSMGL